MRLYVDKRCSNRLLHVGFYPKAKRPMLGHRDSFHMAISTFFSFFNKLYRKQIDGAGAGQPVPVIRPLSW